MRTLKQVAINMADAFTRFGLWKEGGSGGSSSLSELTDVTLSNLQANDVLKYNGSVWINDDNLQKQIDTLNSNFNNYEIKILTSTETTSNVGTFSFNYTNELPNGGILLLVYTANSNYWCKLYGLSNGNCILGIADFNNQNSANIQHTVYSYWLVKK